MTTIHAKVSRTDCYLKVDGSLTSGMVGVPISFEFTPEWKELKKTAVFYAGTVKRDRINIERSATVPAEVLQKSMENLYVGIYGYREDGTIVIPTVMAKVGLILRGANPSGDPGVDPNLPIWAELEQRVSDLEEESGDAAVKSVNGIAPDENGNVEIKIPEGSGSSVTIDTTLTQSGQAADAKAVGDALAELEKKIPEQPADAELFDKADLPLDNQSFVTVDGVEYYRYHAGPTNFTWNNPHPQTGSVTITARGVSQYGGTGTTRLKTVYNDGTFGPDIYIVVGGESRTASVTTDENKTLAKITGNYDLENWVLLDVSVMSVVLHDYVPTVAIDNTLTKSGAAADAKAVGDALTELEKKIPEQPVGKGLGITGAAVGQTIKIAAVDDNGVPTAWEPVNESPLRLITSLTLEENSEGIEITGLNIDKPFTLLLYKPGDACKSGWDTAVNGKTKWGYTGTITRTLTGRPGLIQWFYEKDSMLTSHAYLASGEGLFYTWVHTWPVNKLYVKPHYADGSEVYISAGAILELWEGLYPNVI